MLAAADAQDGGYFHALLGVIAEWTSDASLLEKGPLRFKAFQGLYGVGKIVGSETANGYDLLDFDVSFGPGSASPPASYGGMSGGALWRVFGTLNAERGQLIISKRLLFGVAFFESELPDSKLIIRCHGPLSIYNNLVDAVAG